MFLKPLIKATPQEGPSQLRLFSAKTKLTRDRRKSFYIALTRNEKLVYHCAEKDDVRETRARWKI